MLTLNLLNILLISLLKILSISIVRRPSMSRGILGDILTVFASTLMKYTHKWKAQFQVRLV